MALDLDTIKWLTDVFGKNVKFNEPMSKHTSLRVGGPAESYVIPETIEALKSLINRAWQKDIPYLIVGEGTNLLVNDRGVRGIVIVLSKCLKKIWHTARTPQEVMVTAMAGVRMQTLCRYAIDRGLAGLNFALGIPGTVGGGIVMNAGTAYGWIEDVLETISLLLPTGEILKISRDRLKFSYRGLACDLGKNQIYQDQAVIVDGSFSLKCADPQTLKQEADKILKKRKQRQPTEIPSAGCFFKNPTFEKSAGELIELAGLKGRSIGGAEVSTKHANFLVNTGKASAADFLALMELVQETVYKKFNIDLEREVKIVGT